MEVAEEIKPKKRSLNEIVEEFRRVLHTLDDAEGEVLPELEDELRNCEDSLVDKVDRCLWVNKEITAQAEVYAERAKSLEDRARVLKAQAERLRKHVHASLLALGMSRVETPHFVATIAETPWSVIIVDSEVFCAEHGQSSPFVRVKLEVDKKAVKDRLLAGEEINGAGLAKTTALRVK